MTSGTLRRVVYTPLLVTSAVGVNGIGYGTLPASTLDGRPLDAFSDDNRFADPHGLTVDRNEKLFFLNNSICGHIRILSR